jgi:hypothetical protein
MRAFTLFLMYDATGWTVSAVTFEMYGSIFRSSSSKLCDPYVHWRRIIHSVKKVFSMTFTDGFTRFKWCRPNYNDLTLRVDQNCFCSTRILSRGNGSLDDILSICLAQENRKMAPVTHSGRLSKNEMPGRFLQWVAASCSCGKDTLALDLRKLTG